MAAWATPSDTMGDATFGLEPVGPANAEGSYWIGLFFPPGEDTALFFERYVCPRFTEPDEAGRVIVDYCFYVRPEQSPSGSGQAC